MSMNILLPQGDQNVLKGPFYQTWVGRGGTGKQYYNFKGQAVVENPPEKTTFAMKERGDVY